MLLIVALCYSGLCALSLAMSRHHRQWRGRPPAPRWVGALRGGGSLLLAAATALALREWGWGVGLVLVFSAAGLGGLVLVVLLTYQPRLAAVLGVALPVMALALRAM